MAGARARSSTSGRAVLAVDAVGDAARSPGPAEGGVTAGPRRLRASSRQRDSAGSVYQGSAGTYTGRQFAMLGVGVVRSLGHGGLGDVYCVRATGGAGGAGEGTGAGCRSRGTTDSGQAAQFALKICGGGTGWRRRLRVERMQQEHRALEIVSSSYPLAVPRLCEPWSRDQLESVRLSGVAAVRGTSLFHDGDVAAWWRRACHLVRGNDARLSLCCSVVLQMAAALAAVHSCGLVHADVKLENALVDTRFGPRGRPQAPDSPCLFPYVVLSDLDVSAPCAGGRHAAASGDGASSSDDAREACVRQRALTHSSRSMARSVAPCVGTPDDWAPELARANGWAPRTPETDVWALAVAAWTMANSHRHPFEKSTVEATHAHVVRGGQPRVHARGLLATRAAGPLRALLMRALAMDPRDRLTALQIASDAWLLGRARGARGAWFRTAAGARDGDGGAAEP